MTEAPARMFQIPAGTCRADGRPTGVVRGWRTLAGLFLVGGLGGSGCSSDAPVQAAEFPSAFVRAACSRVQECCNADGGNRLDRESLQTACEVNSEFVAALMGDLGRAVNDRRAAYDPERAERCLQQIRAAACGMHIDVARHDVAGPDCAAAVRGLSGADDPCKSSWDCPQGGFCDGPPGIERCVLRRSEAAECMRDDQCASGDCQQGRCAASPALMCPQH